MACIYISHPLTHTTPHTPHISHPHTPTPHPHTTHTTSSHHTPHPHITHTTHTTPSHHTHHTLIPPSHHTHHTLIPPSHHTHTPSHHTHHTLTPPSQRCQFKCGSVGGMTYHFIRCAGNTPMFRCTHCPRSYESRTGLNYHMASSHCDEPLLLDEVYLHTH